MHVPRRIHAFSPLFGRHPRPRSHGVAPRYSPDSRRVYNTRGVRYTLFWLFVSNESLSQCRHIVCQFSPTMASARSFRVVSAHYQSLVPLRRRERRGNEKNWTNEKNETNWTKLTGTERRSDDPNSAVRPPTRALSVRNTRFPSALDAAMPFDAEMRAKRTMDAEKALTIGIVGFGNFGQFLARRLIAAGHRVICTSRGDYTVVAREMGARYFSNVDDFCEQHPDVVLLATSILSFQDIVKGLPVQRLRRSTLFVDVRQVLVGSVTRCCCCSLLSSAVVVRRCPPHALVFVFVISVPGVERQGMGLNLVLVWRGERPPRAGPRASCSARR